MPRKTLSYHEITKAAEDQLRWLAELTFESEHMSDEQAGEWAHGITLYWQKLAGRLDLKEDRAAQIALEDDAVLQRLKSLFTVTLKKLRDEAAQDGKED
ncbi:hypothetical protein [Marinomonas sp.]|uniref:hypothetical protein n=1 Tax=Marinomonas sp. TaxID=1904862 RepID=UPI003A92F838